MSIASWVGIIALLGIRSLAGIREGALSRLRPKVMTTLTTFTSLIPAMNILCPHINLGYLPCNLFCDLREEGMITLICLTLEDYIKGVKKNYEVLAYRNRTLTGIPYAFLQCYVYGWCNMP